MQNCSKCSPIKNIFDTVGKTYYLLEDDSLLCYRHWYQEGKPKYKKKDEYNAAIRIDKIYIKKQKNN